MEKYLRPEKFDANPSESSATQSWEHWRKTFESFIAAHTPAAPSSSDKDAQTVLQVPTPAEWDNLKYQLLVNHVSPNVYTYISEVSSYDKAIAILHKLYVKPKNILYARHMLATRKQCPNENIDSYLQALKQLSKDCDFAAVDAETNKNDNVRDAFISGISSSKIRQRLLENLNLTLDQAYNQALSLETAEVSSQSFNTQSLNAVHGGAAPVSTNQETIQGGSYSAATYPRQRKCFYCGGHIHPLKNCPALVLNTRTREDTSQTCQTLTIGDHNYDNVTFLIVKNICADIIIGHDVLGNHASLEFSFGGPKETLHVCNVAEASVPAVPLFVNVSPECKPIAVKSRKHSDEDTKFIKQEIENLLAEGVIEESKSPWRAQVLITKNETHRKRLVIDYSRTINRYTELDAYPLPNIEQLVTKVAKNKIFSLIDLKGAYHQVPILPEERKYTAFEALSNLYQFRRIPFGNLESERTKTFRHRERSLRHC
ncbi:hypothetical protein ABMA28_010656 [Loxostege sticticalis]|uniref:Reverse transcriptase domain-containing protein n=1 Tax=Loxostege sticticalis TaxID=481309 RepID=A0ABD0S8Z9_LOXSC